MANPFRSLEGGLPTRWLTDQVQGRVSSSEKLILSIHASNLVQAMGDFVSGPEFRLLGKDQPSPSRRDDERAAMRNMIVTLKRATQRKEV